ncbi:MULTISPECIES: NAD(P)H-binding protein [Leuconostoc]|uniref:NAD(P)H-binding protein n=1 Tax=Leuconostoc TaxID=1243 RepID=UPI001B8D3423|nr:MULTISPECIES: NAD(P)H-binding protein [Leuconostoc]MBS0941868.1 NAD(P)H-binding protein [Leuconostoc mesenteroides]MBS1008167.1 NAD(P)H-binding protein [Leuconostoc suionicum]
MTKVMILGASGSIGRVVRNRFLNDTDFDLVTLSRHKITKLNNSRETSFVGDLFDTKLLTNAMRGVDVVFASLSGDLPKMASIVIDIMHITNVKRLIFITSMGIYNEIPNHIGSSGNLFSNPMLKSYRVAADVIETSNLNYTIIRPGWFDNGDNGSSSDYEITKKGEPFGGHDVSRQSIADLVVKIVDGQIKADNQNLGINRPE